LFKKPGNGRLNNLNDPILNVLNCFISITDLSTNIDYMKVANTVTCWLPKHKLDILLT